MELKLKINSKNTFPKRGIFIKSGSVEVWLNEIQKMGLNLDIVKVFPVPSTKANELFGCLVIFNSNNIKLNDIGKNNFCQLVENKLFIPENTSIEPQLTKEEWNTLFSEQYHFLHPEIGLAELNEEVAWNDLIQIPEEKNVEIVEPSKTVSIPQFISSLRLEIDPEKILESIENPYSEEEMIAKLPFNLQKLMKGNQREMDKFLAFLEKNPELALKMAIPLDTLGTSRGGTNGKLSFGSGGFGKSLFPNATLSGTVRWAFILFFVLSMRACSLNNLSSIFSPSFGAFIVIAVLLSLIVLAVKGNWSSGSSSSGGSALVDNDRFNTLQSRYEKLAEGYIEKKEYAKAAHIYMKLLKNPHKAAGILEQGEMYNEAAAIYLKYANNKTKAAECYEKGHAYQQAIEIHKEFNNAEKVGDLYLVLKNKKEANKYFTTVIENYKTNFQYVKASLLYKNKIGNVTEAQEMLLEGWKTNRDASNCLNNYFANINSEEKLSKAISDVYRNDVSETNSELFLQLMKHEFKKHESLEELTKNIAYEIVADKIDSKPEIATELIHFNEKNRSMVKDVMKYKIKAKKRP